MLIWLLLTAYENMCRSSQTSRWK